MSKQIMSFSPVRTMFVFVIFYLCVFQLCDANGSARLIEPAMRSSLWRFNDLAMVNYNDQSLDCGGPQVQFNLNRGRCGVCGDPYNNERQNERGGKYDSGIIARRYRTGSQVTMVADVVAGNGGGYFEVKLCPRNNARSKVTQACFNKYPLKITNGKKKRLQIPENVRNPNGLYRLDVKLPKGVACTHCVIQWHYHAANEWGYDANGRGCMGCGPQTEIFNCADVAIGYAGDSEAKAGPAADLSLGALAEVIDVYSNGQYGTGVSPIVVNSGINQGWASATDLTTAMDYDYNNNNNNMMMDEDFISSLGQESNGFANLFLGDNMGMTPLSDYDGLDFNMMMSFVSGSMGGGGGGGGGGGSSGGGSGEGGNNFRNFQMNFGNRGQSSNFGGGGSSSDEEGGGGNRFSRRNNAINIPSLNRQYNMLNGGGGRVGGGGGGGGGGSSSSSGGSSEGGGGGNGMSRQQERNMRRLQDALRKIANRQRLQNGLNDIVDEIRNRNNNNNNNNNGVNDYYNNDYYDAGVPGSEEESGADYNGGNTLPPFFEENIGGSSDGDGNGGGANINNNNNNNNNNNGVDYYDGTGGQNEYGNGNYENVPLPEPSGGGNGVYDRNNDNNNIDDYYNDGANNVDYGNGDGGQGVGGGVDGGYNDNYGDGNRGDFTDYGNVPAPDYSDRERGNNNIYWREPGFIDPRQAEIDRLEEEARLRQENGGGVDRPDDWSRRTTRWPYNNGMGQMNPNYIYGMGANGMNPAMNSMSRQFSPWQMSAMLSTLNTPNGQLSSPNIGYSPYGPNLNGQGQVQAHARAQAQAQASASLNRIFPWMPSAHAVMSIGAAKSPIFSQRVANHYMSPFMSLSQSHPALQCQRPDQLVCRATPNYSNIPDADAICTTKCRSGGACGSDYCSCACQKSLVCVHRSSQAMPGQLGMNEMDMWCTNQCNTGQCPNQVCACNVLV